MNRKYRLLAAALLSLTLFVGDFSECLRLYNEIREMEQKIDEKNVDLLQVEYRDVREEHNEEYIENVLASQQEVLRKQQQEIDALDSQLNAYRRRNGIIAEYIDTYDERHEDSLSFMALNYTRMQYPDFPTGCESVALHILLRYYDVDAPILEIVSRLPKAPMPVLNENYEGTGYDPELYFIGDPLTRGGYGVFNHPIAEVAETFKEGVICRDGMEFSELLELLDQGRAVMVWSTIDLKTPEISRKWLTPEGRTVYWLRHEHAVVVIGYDDTTVTVSDPHTGTIRTMDRDRFILVYNQMGRRAVYY
ncbi:MAG: C39 family peptidase [Erysipelotrichaceae bacterium]|nr:C39 family peptidase [Erysipelotrichaceae bacterium]